MSDERNSVEDVAPMKPLDAEHDGEPDVAEDSAEVGGVGAAPDLTDPLKRDDEDDMPGLDPTPPVVPSD